MSAVDTKKLEAEKILPEISSIIWSDMMKAHHYIEKSLQVAILAGAEEYAQELASISVRLATDIKYLEHLENKYLKSAKSTPPFNNKEK